MVEFGASDGDIKMQYFFTTKMKKFCNTYATIKSIYGNSEVVLKNFSKKVSYQGGYIFTLDMLKPAKEEKKQKKDLASEDLQDCVEYGLKGYKVIPMDDKILTLDEQIKWHEERLAELKAQKEKEKWAFTEDEKVILRNLPEEYEWIARDECGELFVFENMPKKEDDNWTRDYMSDCERFILFKHLFQCIQFTDTEPCEFRKYI